MQLFYVDLLGFLGYNDAAGFQQINIIGDSNRHMSLLFHKGHSQHFFLGKKKIEKVSLTIKRASPWKGSLMRMILGYTDFHR
jgi:hypothetical protein